MGKLNKALALAKQGFHVFPLEPDSKLPAIEGWVEKATRDEKQIRRWWTDPVMGEELDRNIGIYTGRFGDNKALVVIDVDVKNGKDGFKHLTQYDVPGTMRALTPSGGMHIIFVVDKPLKQGVNVLGEGLDIRSYGGYIAAPGSTTESGEYKWEN